MASSNPWIKRFDALDRAALAERMMKVPAVLKACAKDLDEIAIGRLKTSISEIFLPTTRVLDIAEYVVGLAKAHTTQFYPSKRAYIEGVYSKDAPNPPEHRATDLTGPAGVGKTATLNALIRCMNDPIEVLVPNHAPIESRLCWVSRMEEGLSPTNLLRNYLALDGEPNESNTHKGAQLRARRRAYWRGVSLVATDETQFGSFSSNATALITKTLMAMVRLGVPNLYVSNYSLGHRLARRGQEDRDRLQSDPLVLLPDTPEDDDWLWTIRQYQDLAPRLYQFDAESMAEQIHFWTAGLKRLLGRLLVLGAEEARRSGEPVTEKLLQRAFKSTAYSMSREDVVILHAQAKTNKQANRSRPDLWCPYELPAIDRAKQAAAARAADKKKVMKGYMESAMSPDEKRRHKELERAKKRSGGKKATVTQIHAKKSKAQALKDAEREFTNDR